MAGTSLNAIQYLNYLALTLLRESCDRDPISACATFGLTKAELNALRPHLSAERVLAAVANTAQESLLSIRPDIREILASPPPLLGALSAVRSLPPPARDSSTDTSQTK